MLINFCNLTQDGHLGAKNTEFNMKASESQRKTMFRKRNPLPFSLKITVICLVCGVLSALLYLLTLMMTAVQVSLE